jgi:RNA polymerase sigma-54 factor
LQFQKPVMSQEQRLRMNPQMYQSIQLMALPLQDLKTRIQEELEKNPALEIIDDKSAGSLEDFPDRQSDTEEDYFDDISDASYSSSAGDDSDGDSKRKYIEGVLSRPESLQDHLLWQLRLQPIPEPWFRLGELLIRNLDENGFHLEPPENLARGTDAGTLEAVMELIRSFEPVGTCVKDYRESLVVQARLDPDTPPYTIELIENHLEALEKGKLTEIARKMKLDEAEVRNALEFIKTLTPFPGRLYSNETPRYVTPDIQIKLKDGEFVIVLNDEEIPVLGIDPFFTGLLTDTTGSRKELRRYVSSNLREAKWFIRSIHQRNQTLVKTAKALVEFQRDFFLKGPKYLVPLTLKDIAKAIGVHEATVSRIANGKYVQTEWGIFELKFFFSNSITGAGSTGSRFSKEGVKQVIKEIIMEEGDGRNLSDQKIAELLKSRGINLARRTVAKYRNELDISSSYNR